MTSPFSDPTRDDLRVPAMRMRLVILESPYAGDIKANIAYARAALRDCLLRGEAPIASHLLLTQEGVLDDAIPSERAQGINAGHAWMRTADVVAVYTDRGISEGMRAGIRSAQFYGVTVEYRSLEQGGGTNGIATGTST